VLAGGIGLSPSKAALRPHEALYSVRQHKKIGLTVRRIILNNFFRRNRKPLIFYPSIPPIFWIPFVTGLYLKFRLYGVGYPATEKRFFVSVWMLGVVRTFETLKPSFVRRCIEDFRRAFVRRLTGVIEAPQLPSRAAKAANN
jgi:hypothetical protein